MGWILVRAISWFAQLIMLLLLLRAVCSWFVRDLNSPLGQVYNVLGVVTEPIVEPCRRLLSRFNTGPFDWSVLLAMIIVEIVSRLLILLVGAVL